MPPNLRREMMRGSVESQIAAHSSVNNASNSPMPCVPTWRLGYSGILKRRLEKTLPNWTPQVQNWRREVYGRSFRGETPYKQGKTVPVQCAKGHQWVHCPNQIWGAHQPSAVPSGGGWLRFRAGDMMIVATHEHVTSSTLRGATYWMLNPTTTFMFDSRTTWNVMKRPVKCAEQPMGRKAWYNYDSHK